MTLLAQEKAAAGEQHGLQLTGCFGTRPGRLVNRATHRHGFSYASPRPGTSLYLLARNSVTAGDACEHSRKMKGQGRGGDPRHSPAIEAKFAMCVNPSSTPQAPSQGLESCRLPTEIEMPPIDYPSRAGRHIRRCAPRPRPRALRVGGAAAPHRRSPGNHRLSSSSESFCRSHFSDCSIRQKQLSPKLPARDRQEGAGGAGGRPCPDSWVPRYALFF